MTQEALFVELTQLTRLDRARWDRILSEPPAVQRLLLENYQDQDWTDPATPVGTRVLQILGILGAVGSDVGTVAGAVTAAAALRAL